MASLPTSLSTPISSLMLGVCLHACFIGAYLSGISLMEIKWTRNRRKNGIVLFGFCLAFNIVAAFNAVFSFWSYLVGPEYCYLANLLLVLCFHGFVIIFEAFMLYKSYIVTHQNKFFGICSILILVFRLGWSVTDAIWATGSWDYTQGACIFNENATSGLFYTIADISADVIATAGAVIMFFLSGSYKLGLRSVSYLIARENILRSSVVLLFESFFLYATLVWKDAGAFQVLFTVQNLVYIFLMNMELVWKTVRDQEDVKSFICSGDDNQNTLPGAEKDDGGLGHTV